MTEYLTLGSLNEVLNEVGLSTGNVARDGIYFDCVLHNTGERRMILVIKSYALDENRKRYIGTDGEVAMETRRFFVKSLGPLEPCPTLQENHAVVAQ